MTPDELKTFRHRYNLTQPQLADELGMTRHAINLMEMGRTPIRKVTVLALKTVARKLHRKRTPQNESILSPRT